MSDLLHPDSESNPQRKKSKKSNNAHTAQANELRSWHGINGFHSFDAYIDEDDPISYGDGHSGWNR